MSNQHVAQRHSQTAMFGFVGGKKRSARTLVVAIVAVSFAYYLTARLSLLLAIPPGYATAVWPASGIALAALLLYGRHLWPGVLLGSFLANAPTALSAPDASTEALLIAFSIGVGASLQAWLAARMLKPTLRRDPGLLETRSMGTVLGLGAMFCCLVSATWGSVTLVVAGATSIESFAVNWVTWWVGDVIGVVLMLPLAYIVLGSPRALWRPRFVPVAVPLALTLVAVTFVFFASNIQEKHRTNLEFDREAGTVGDALERNLATYLEALHSIQSLYAASQMVTRDDFRQFVERALQRLPGIHALSWNPRVKNAERRAFEAAAREDGLSDFQIRQFSNDGLIPASEHPEYVFVYYIEPMAGNESVLGFDVYSYPERRTALDEARDTGKVVSSGAITLVQETDNQIGMLVFVPVYSSHVALDDVQERRERLLGYAVGVLRVGDLLETTIKDTHTRNLDVRFSPLDSTAPGDATTAFRVDDEGLPHKLPAGSAEQASTGLLWSENYSIGNRSWALSITPAPAYFANHTNWQAWTLLAGGLSLTALLGVFLMSLTGRRMLDEQTANQLASANLRLCEEMQHREQAEHALQSERDWAKITLHSIGDGVVSTDEFGVIEYLNPAAEQYSGWRQEEAVGKPVTSVFRIINESTREPTDPVRWCLEERRVIHVVDQLLLVSRDGVEYAIQDSAAPIRDRDNRIRGAVLVFNDVTESRRMVREVSHQASHDPLTELYNRREFDKRLKRLLVSSKKYGSQHVLCYLDLDHFKKVNDTAGHRAGDQLLKRLAKLLESQVRERDTIARLGGDEFGILLDNCPIEKAVEISEKIVASVRTFKFTWEDRIYQVGASIGVVPVSSDVETAEALSARADAACYVAKNLGRNRIHLSR